METIGFILPTYGQYEYAKRAAKSFMESTTSVRPVVILVDDASPEGFDAYNELVLEIKPERSFRFSANGGLTRSWNAGLAMGRDFDYLICGNSDLVFSKHWDYNVLLGLKSYDLVGPTTNASGWGTPRQNIKYHQTYNLSDNQRLIDETQREIDHASYRAIPLAAPKITYAAQGVQLTIPELLNGFCMIAKSKTWHSGKFSTSCVFNPANKMTENETELQMRWALLGRRSAVVRSFVFHYRAITRGDAALCEGAYRP